MQALDRIDFSNNWLTLVFMFLLILLVVLKTINQQKLFGYSRAFFSSGFIAKKTEEKDSFFTLFNLIIFFFSSIIYTIIFSLFGQYFFNMILSFAFFTKVFSLVFVYLLLFLLVDVGIAKLFEIENEIKYIFSSKIAYLYNTSLIIFPLLIVASYSKLSTYVLFVFFIALFLVSIFLIFINNKNLIINKLFYFILYLCTLEIAPLLIIYKITV